MFAPTLTSAPLSLCHHISQLGLCVTVLKQRCREHGITRWPYRKVRSFVSLLKKTDKTHVITLPTEVVCECELGKNIKK